MVEKEDKYKLDVIERVKVAEEGGRGWRGGSQA